MGVVNKNNTVARTQWGRYYLEGCRYFQMSAFIWDNGYWDNTKTCDDIFGHFHRSELTWENGNFLSTLIKAGRTPLGKIKEKDLFLVEPIPTFDWVRALKDNNLPVSFDNGVSSFDVIEELGFGWNLGNTFDAWEKGRNQGLDSETCWGNPKTTPELIDFVAKSGFKAIRIPTTWHNHLIDDKYTIDPKWMKRVKKVVDICLEKGLYVILNTHHDNAEPNRMPLPYGRGYYPLKKDIVESEKFIYNVWVQIATAFNNGYDHHLIFEGLNEPRLIRSQYEWWYNPEDWS